MLNLFQIPILFCPVLRKFRCVCPKEKGVTGHDAAIEAQKVITEQAIEALSYVINLTFMADVKYQDIAELLAHVIDIFMPRKFDINPSAIAEDLLHYIFTYTDLHNHNYHKWLANNFVDLEEMSDVSSSPEAQTQTEQPKAKNIGENSDEESDGDLRSLASQISSVMKNDAMPTQLFNVMADEFSHTPKDWRTPESVLFNLKEMKRAEGKSA